MRYFSLNQSQDIPSPSKIVLHDFQPKLRQFAKKVHDLEIERHNAEIQRLKGVKESLTCEIISLERQTPHELSALKFLQGTRDKVFGSIQKTLNEKGFVGQINGIKRIDSSYTLFEMKDGQEIRMLTVNELSGVIMFKTARGLRQTPPIPELSKLLRSGIAPELEMLEKAYPITSAMKTEKRKQKVIHSL